MENSRYLDTGKFKLINIRIFITVYGVVHGVDRVAYKLYTTRVDVILAESEADHFLVISSYTYISTILLLRAQR